MAILKKIFRLHCLCTLCGWDWQTRKPGKPAHCPRCRSPRWNAMRRLRRKRRVSQQQEQTPAGATN
jgi:predicted Zn-ribbon and HTH transcriptional regulator